MSTKFYVYGGGRWRELDLNTGRVSGWASNARLLVARRGRLECARAAPVLRALRALAAGEPSRARDGPRLPHFRWDDEERRLHQINHISPCHHCCQHRNNVAVENSCGHAVTVASALPPPAPLAAPPAPASLPAPPAPAQLSTRTPKEINDIFDKLKNDTLQKPDPISSRGTTHSPHKRAIKKRQRSTSSSSVEFLTVNDKYANNLRDKQKKEYVRTIRYKGRGRPVRRNSGNVLGIVTLATPKTGLNANTQVKIATPKKASTSTRKTTTEARHNGEVTRNVENLTNFIKQKIESTARNDGKQRGPNITRGNKSDEEGEDSSDIEDNESIADAKKIFAHALHNGGCATMYKRTRWGMPDGNTEVSKELVIDEDDVAALRAFLERHAPDVSLHQFDYDDDYKRAIFYRLNPLVLLERNAEMRQMLGADELSLRDFASQLGLRSVSDEPIHRRKQLNGAATKSGRKRNQPDRYSVLTSTSHKSPKKKDTVVPPTASRQSSSNMKNSKKAVAQNNNETAPKSRPISPPPAPPPRSPSPARAQPPPQPELRPRQQAAKPARGKGGGVKEYSRAEDAAIVAWISSEGRARFVNGNRIWHELQDQFQHLTGNGRTWQSLRNRYLRYILPSLSSLEVPPARAARLRADAATGEIKRKRWPARRNSIFATPGVRGAWSRRPRSPLRTPAAPAPLLDKDAGNSSSEDNVRARRSPSSEKLTQARRSSSDIPRRATRTSSGKQMRARRSSSSEPPQPPTHSLVGKLKRARRSSSSEPQPRPKRSLVDKLPQATSSVTPVRPTRSSMAKLTAVQRSPRTATPTRPTHTSPVKPIQARRSSSSEPQIRPTRSSTAKLKGARRSSSPATKPRPSRVPPGKPKQARRSSSLEPETRPTRLSTGKSKQARRSLSSEPETRRTHLSTGKSKQARRSLSSEPETRPTRLSTGKSKQARRLLSSEPETRPTRLSTGKSKQARRSLSSEPETRPTRSSTGKSKQAQRSLSSEPETRPTRLSTGKSKQARRSLSSEPETRPTRSSTGKSKQVRRSSSSEPEARPKRLSTGKSKQASRSSSSEPETRPTRSSTGKFKQARRSSSSEPETRPTRSSANLNGARRTSNSKKPKRARSSSSDMSIELIHSSNSSSSVSSRQTRGPNLRYSDVTRRFARKQNARHKEESTSSSSAPSPPPAAKGPRSRRLYNPKAAL